jgi:cell wall-associated NlpC family hydrolase
MMAPLALLLVGAGVLYIWSGLANANPFEQISNVVQGKPVTAQIGTSPAIPATTSAGAAAGTVGGKAGAFVAAARAEIGKPYTYGSQGPAAFDCSGLVYYCAQQVGVSLPPPALAQSTKGTAVSEANAAPGDLVFFNPLNVHHVGIVSRPGFMIDAAHTGTNVREEAIWSEAHFYRRVM